MEIGRMEIVSGPLSHVPPSPPSFSPLTWTHCFPSLVYSSPIPPPLTWTHSIPSLVHSSPSPPHLDPLYPLSRVLLLFLFEDEFNKQLLEFLIAIVDAHLLKTTKGT